MNFVLWFIALAIVFAVVTQIATALRVSKLRRAGLYPQSGQASMADVERLLKSDMPSWAMRCYREIHGGTLRQAKDAITKLSATL